MNDHMRRRTLRRAGLLLGVLMAPVLLVGAVLLASRQAAASSHREAPLISQDAFADNTDTYVFVPRGQTENVVMIANWIPFEGPEGGPNYFEWSEDVLYYIYVDNDGDAVADVTYTLSSRTEIVNASTFLYNVSTIDSLDDPDWNKRQYVTVTETWEPGGAPPGSDEVNVLVDDQLTNPVNIGSKSTPAYGSLYRAARRQYMDPGNGDRIRIFGGPTDDPFFVDLQVFDLLTLRGQAPPVGYSVGTNEPVDSLSGFNVHTLAIEMPIDRLTRDGDPVLGVWAASARPSMTVLNGDGTRTHGTDYTQVSRLGMPLVNEVVLPLSLKDTFNAIAPSVDATVYSLLQESVEDPELGNLLCALYAVPLPGDTDDDCDTEYTAGVLRSGRGDIVDIFLQGMVLANEFTIIIGDGSSLTLPAGYNVNRPVTVTPAEMIRINTALSGDTCSPTPHPLGLLGGDACGFPNGRRPTDDVVDIELAAVAGAAYEVLDDRDADFIFDAALLDILRDGVDNNDRPFGAGFPYMPASQAGQSHVHTNSGVDAQGNAPLINTAAPSGKSAAAEAAPATFYGFTVSMTGAPWLELLAVVVPALFALGFWAWRRRAAAA